MIPPHFVFAYGSLICPASRAVTAPTLVDRRAIPVLVQNIERAWAKRSDRFSATSMGVQFRDGAECVGVLIPVNDKELRQFDRREDGYDRYPIDVDDVSPVSFLDQREYYEDTFLKETSTEPSQKIWVYVQRKSLPPTPGYPIPQSYVDIILRGCLTISEEFAKKVVETTKGWDPADLADSSDSDSSDDEGFWVDDRADPLYVRADSEYSIKYAKRLDNVLKEASSPEIESRVAKGRSEVVGI